MNQFVFEVPMNSRNKVTPHPVDPEAQKAELLDRFRRANEDTHLVPGDLCREKRGLTTFTHDPVLIFWRWLDQADRHDWQIIKGCIKEQMCSEVDCLVAFLDDDSIHVRIMPNESWRLEHLPETPP